MRFHAYTYFFFTDSFNRNLKLLATETEQRTISTYELIP